MANNNRNEAAAFIEALAAVVDLEELKEVLNDQFAQSVLFRKDVSSSVVASDNAPSVNFTDIDYISLDLNTPPVGTFTITISGVQQGEIKYLSIEKGVGDNLLFSGATDAADSPSYIASQTTVLYEITNKDGTNIFATPLSRGIGDPTTSIKGIVEKATAAERNSGAADKYIDAELLGGATGLMNRVFVEIGDWNMDTTANITFAHGQDITKIIGMTTIIRNDLDTVRTSLIGDGIGTAALSYGSSMNVTATLISLNRVTTGVFDGTDYDSTSYNRGWVVLELLP